MGTILKTTQLLTAAGLVAANRALLAAGARKKLDGWRRAAGLVLRSEASTFMLSAFGLDAWSDVPRERSANIELTREHVADRLKNSLSRHAVIRTIVQRSKEIDEVRRGDAPNYTLRFEAWADGHGRFSPPEKWVDAKSENPVLMNCVCRMDGSGRVDLWARMNHVGTDGVPAQEVMTAIETEWGIDESVRYPEVFTYAGKEPLQAIEGRDGIAQTQVFLDFAPLLAWRKRENAKLAAPMTISAAVMWWLGQHALWRDAAIGTTVEVIAKDGLDRGVGVVVVRAADYFDRADGLAQFVSDVNRDLELTRQRESESFKILDAAAHLPPRLARTLLQHALENNPRAFGNMALTVLKDARVFGAPVACAGHEYGFLAIGSIGLPTGDGSKVGCITARGPRERIAKYPQALREAFAQITSV